MRSRNMCNGGFEPCKVCGEYPTVLEMDEHFMKGRQEYRYHVSCRCINGFAFAATIAELKDKWNGGNR